MEINSIAVFCASSKGVNPIYLEKAFELGKELARNNIRLVYGGATVGAMGAVAEGCLSENGKVTGVIPHFLNKREIAHLAIDRLIKVDSMHERKLLLNQLSDAFITLPGGYGTMEEFFEIITWGQLGLHQKPSLIYNVNNYYDHLIAQIRHMHTEDLLKKENFNMLLSTTKQQDILPLLRNYQAPEIEAWLKDDNT